MKRILVTPEEAFWSGKFGDQYVLRNTDQNLIQLNTNLFKKMLRKTNNCNSFFEFGCNVGYNLDALKKINKSFIVSGIEINKNAFEIACKKHPGEIIHGSFLQNAKLKQKYDLCFTKGVLIHINPKKLDAAYDKLFNHSKKYILICEYFNPTPSNILYRGHKKRLYKRDFAGEMIKKFKLKLIDYGFIYRYDSAFPNEDWNWFLMKK